MPRWFDRKKKEKKKKEKKAVNWETLSVVLEAQKRYHGTAERIMDKMCTIKSAFGSDDMATAGEKSC